MSESLRCCKVLVILQNKHGLHARPAHLWVQTANSFASRLSVGRPDGEKVDGKSIMGIMMLAAESGTTLELEAEGPDCAEQLRALQELVDSRFGEE
jgi:phosphocarrier protein